MDLASELRVAKTRGQDEWRQKPAHKQRVVRNRQGPEAECTPIKEEAPHDPRALDREDDAEGKSKPKMAESNTVRTGHYTLSWSEHTAKNSLVPTNTHSKVALLPILIAILATCLAIYFRDSLFLTLCHVPGTPSSHPHCFIVGPIRSTNMIPYYESSQVLTIAHITKLMGDSVIAAAPLHHSPD